MHDPRQACIPNVLSKGVDSFIDARHRACPGWVKDRIIGADFFQAPDRTHHVVEYIVSESVTNGQLTDEITISVLLNDSANSELQVNYADDGIRFSRRNRRGEVLIKDESLKNTCEGDGPFHSLMLYVNRTFLRHRFEELSNGKAHWNDSLLRRSHDDDGLIVLIRQLFHLHTHHDHDHLLLAGPDLMDGICRRLITMSGEKTDDGFKEMQIENLPIKRVIEYINDNYHRSFSRNELADVAGLNSSHFARRFRQIAGCSPTNYVRLVRIQRAKEMLLKQIDLPVVNVASCCGYFDASHFQREFRELVGTTPQNFRRFR